MKDLPLDNDFEFEYQALRKNASTGALEPATGLAGLTCRISLTDGGAAVDASLLVSAAERAGAPGQYFGVFQGDALRAHLTSPGTCFEVFGDGTNVLSSIPRRIVNIRRP